MNFKFPKVALLSVAMFIAGTAMVWSDTHNVGSGQQFASLKAAMASSLVTAGDMLYVTSNLTENNTVINKRVRIEGPQVTPRKQITVTGTAPFKITAADVIIYFVDFYTTLTNVNLVQIEASASSLYMFGCNFKKSSAGTYSCLACYANGFNAWVCGFQNGYHAIWADNATTNFMGVNKSNFSGCTKGIYFRNTSTTVNSYSLFYSIYGTVTSANNFGIQTAYPNTQYQVPVTFAYCNLSAPKPIVMGGHTDATIDNVIFSNCSSSGNYAWTKTSTDHVVSVVDPLTLNAPCKRGSY